MDLCGNLAPGRIGLCHDTSHVFALVDVEVAVVARETVVVVSEKLSPAPECAIVSSLVTHPISPS